MSAGMIPTLQIYGNILAVRNIFQNSFRGRLQGAFDSREREKHEVGAVLHILCDG